METDWIRPYISNWRLNADFSQEELDQKAGFSKGTVGRIERLEKNLSDKELVRILVALDMDVSSALLDACGNLFRRLLAAEPGIREEMGKKPPVTETPEQEQFRQMVDQMTDGFRYVLFYFANAAHPKRWLREFMLASAPEEKPPGRKRAPKRG